VARDIGFVLLTHSHPRQIARLLARLNQLFDHPPIACHHDAGQCAFPDAARTPNLRLVEPHIVTQWARFSIVEATVRAIALLYERGPGPDVFIVLSGADYPITNAARIRLDVNGADAFIEHERLEPGFLLNNWQRKRCNDFYGGGGGPVPFGPSLCCFAGSQWFAASRRAASAILDFYRRRPQLADHLRLRDYPDETYFHTILANTPGLQLRNCNWRYLEWRPGSSHPAILTRSDLPRILASPAHFARKFDFDADPALFDAIDAAVDGGGAA
jgi:hypothetical protein